MKTLFKNAKVVNVFTDTIQECDVLVENRKIAGMGKYENSCADKVIDIQGKFICPGLTDSHIHIESTMMIPSNLAKISLPHGTTSIVADPHEIANVAGKQGIDFMLEASKNLPLNVYFTLPSCVPATNLFDESGAELKAGDLIDYYTNKRILGLAEMMNYPGVIYGDNEVHKKISDALESGKVIDGHAPLLSGHQLDQYLAAGIMSDHECSTFEEAIEKLNRGMWIIIREGTAAKNLEGLIKLFEEPYNHRCLIATDDKHPGDLINEGHIDAIIRKAVRLGADPIKAIRMATLQPAQYFKIPLTGAIAPGYTADFIILDNLNEFIIDKVYSGGICIAENGKIKEFEEPVINQSKWNRIYKSFNLKELTESDFIIEEKSKKIRVIQSHNKSLITDNIIEETDWTNNGIDLKNDRIKLAVIERHNNTGHKGIGFIKGSGLKKGAIASSVSHDCHNLIVMGTNEKDMAVAANTVIKNGGGIVCVKDGQILEQIELKIAGLMSDQNAQLLAEKNINMRNALFELGVEKEATPVMTLAFISLSVIPHLKMSTKGLVDVDKFELTDLYVE